MAWWWRREHPKRDLRRQRRADRNTGRARGRGWGEYRSTRRLDRRAVGDGRVRRFDGGWRLSRNQVAARGVRRSARARGGGDRSHAGAREGLGLDASQFENPAREGLVAGISTLIGGAIPVLGYLFGRLLLGSAFVGVGSLAIAFIICGVFLFLIGSARSFFTGKGGVRSGLEMLAVGTVVAALTYAVGVLFRAS